MISGVHAVVFSREADKDRAFFRDVLRAGGYVNFNHVAAGNAIALEFYRIDSE